jgi:proline iminopeptidase
VNSEVDRREFLARSLLSLLSFRAGFSTLGGAADAVEQPRGKKKTMKEVKTGGVRLIQIDGKYKVWTKRVGTGPIKMLTLHGGPGATHEYFECFEDFLPQQGIEFYYYDQLGSAYSDQPDDPSLWTVERFREEVEQVSATLDLQDFYLYG